MEREAIGLEMYVVQGMKAEWNAGAPQAIDGRPAHPIDPRKKRSPLFSFGVAQTYNKETCISHFLSIGYVPFPKGI